MRRLTPELIQTRHAYSRSECPEIPDLLLTLPALQKIAAHVDRAMPLPRQTRNRKGRFPVIEPGAGAAPDLTMLEPILIVAIVIAVTAWYVQHRWRKRLRALAVRVPREGAVLELLALRYARGEIDREEYLQKRSDIVGYPGMRPNPGETIIK